MYTFKSESHDQNIVGTFLAVGCGIITIIAVAIGISCVVRYRRKRKGNFMYNIAKCFTNYITIYS